MTTETPRTDEIMETLTRLIDRDRILAGARIALSMLEYDLRVAQDKLDTVHDLCVDALQKH